MSRYNVRLLRIERPGDLESEMASLGVDPRGVAIMAPKGRFHVLKVEQVAFAAASILKQEMLAKGGEAALSSEIYHGGESATDALLLATDRTLHEVIAVLRVQPLPSLQQLAAELEEALAHATGRTVPSTRIGSRTFQWGERTYVMGIVNATPDSFSGDGLLTPEMDADELAERATAQALAFLEQGADILDVGGESTRPGSQPVTAEVERTRIVPVIRRLRQVTDAPISVDTYRAPVARAALDAGADLVNDVWALQMDPDLAPLVAERGAPVVLMHNRSKPKDAAQEERLGGCYVGVHYQDLLGDVVRELQAQVDAAIAAGIPRERLLIDPGIGFGKTVDQNLRLLNHVDALRVLGLPILVGSSRKSFIGYTLDLPADQRVEGTAATVAIAIARGADVVRVHDVQVMARVARMTDAIVRGN
ncbi:MAG: dihydropteroate synthase [Anaerolineae bacterium]